MTTAPPMGPLPPLPRALEGTARPVERPLAGRVIAQPGRARKRQAGKRQGRGELLLTQGNTELGVPRSSATAERDPCQTGMS